MATSGTMARAILYDLDHFPIGEEPELYLSSSQAYGYACSALQACSRSASTTNFGTASPRGNHVTQIELDTNHHHRQLSRRARTITTAMPRNTISFCERDGSPLPLRRSARLQQRQKPPVQGPANPARRGRPSVKSKVDPQRNIKKKRKNGDLGEEEDCDTPAAQKVRISHRGVST